MGPCFCPYSSAFGVGAIIVGNAENFVTGGNQVNLLVSYGAIILSVYCLYIPPHLHHCLTQSVIECLVT